MDTPSLCCTIWTLEKETSTHMLVYHFRRPVFSRGEVDYLSGSEIAFWTDLIEKYLYPLDADKQKQVRHIIMVIQ